MAVKRPVWATLLVLSIFLTLFQPMQAFAEPIITEEDVGDLDDANFVEKQLSGLLVGIGNTLIALFKAQDVSVLVFQREEVLENAFLADDRNANRESMILNIFPETLFNGVSMFYDFFIGILPIPMLIVLVFTGVGLMLNMMIAPESRNRLKEVLWGTIVMVLLIRFAPWVWEWIVWLNFVVVDGVYALLTENGVEITTFLGTIWSSDAYEDISKVENFAIAIMILFAIFMTFVINYQYMIRMLTLAMLIVMFPFILISAMIPSRRTTINLWFTEFTANVFLQAAHALVLGFFFYFRENMAELGFWLVVTMLFGLPAMVDGVRRLIYSLTGEGMGGGFGTTASNMSGLSSMMAVASMAKSIKGSKKADSTAMDEAGIGREKNNEMTAPDTKKQTGGPAPISASLNNEQVRNNGKDMNGIDQNPTEGAIPTDDKGEKAGITSGLVKAVQSGNKMMNDANEKGYLKAAAVGAAALAGGAFSGMTMGNVSKGAMGGAAAGNALGWGMQQLPAKASGTAPSGSGGSKGNYTTQLRTEAASRLQSIEKERENLIDNRAQALQRQSEAEQAASAAQMDYGHLATQNDDGEIIPHPLVTDADQHLAQAQAEVSQYDQQLNILSQEQQQLESVIASDQSHVVNQGFSFNEGTVSQSQGSQGSFNGGADNSPNIMRPRTVPEIQQTLSQLGQVRTQVEQSKNQAEQTLTQAQNNYQEAVNQYGSSSSGLVHPTVVNAQKAYAQANANLVKHNVELNEIKLQEADQTAFLTQAQANMNQQTQVAATETITGTPVSPPAADNELDQLKNELRRDGRL